MLSPAPHLQNPDSSSQTASVALFQSNASPEPASALPVHLKIPAIGVDAALESVALTPEGEVGVPEDPAHAAWFNLGPRPGDIGNAIIDGHFGWKDGKPAVFDKLHTLKQGDKLFVEDEQGIVISFVVRELRPYAENQVSSDVFDSSDGKAHLVLITCEGVWNKIEKSYSGRLVVFADME
ncbi:MAG: class F sortase [bacterium]|nr:class F sortase [bacterium]